MPSDKSGIMAPPVTALLAVSGAMTPSSSPLPKRLGSLRETLGVIIGQKGGDRPAGAGNGADPGATGRRSGTSGRNSASVASMTAVRLRTSEALTAESPFLAVIHERRRMICGTANRPIIATSRSTPCRSGDPAEGHARHAIDRVQADGHHHQPDNAGDEAAHQRFLRQSANRRQAEKDEGEDFGRPEPDGQRATRSTETIITARLKMPPKPETRTAAPSASPALPFLVI